jgi:hypothetical protein
MDRPKAVATPAVARAADGAPLEGCVKAHLVIEISSASATLGFAAATMLSHLGERVPLIVSLSQIAHLIGEPMKA